MNVGDSVFCYVVHSSPIDIKMAIAFCIMRYVVVLSGAICVAAINTTIPILSPPSSQPLSQNLLSFSIEQDRWPDWTGITKRNEFTHSALLNYAALTGKPPRIRVGANSEDHTVWSPTVTVSHDIILPTLVAVIALSGCV